MGDTLQHVPILNIDVQGFTTYNEATQDTLTRRLQDMLTEVALPFLPASDPWALWRRHGTGDGYYIIFVGHPSPIALQYALQLDVSLATYNAQHGPDLPIRLYGALVLGDVKLIGDQYRSGPFSEAARFLSHAPLKTYLQQQERPMVLAMSALFHTEWREAIRQHNPFPETAALQWTPFTCRDKHGSDHAGYVRGPGWEQPRDAEPPAARTASHPSAAPPVPVERPARVTDPIRYAGETKLNVCRRLGANWRDLADYFEIPPHERDGFAPGREPHGVWEWLEARQRLSALAQGLAAIGRHDLVEVLQHDPR